MSIRDQFGGADVGSSNRYENFGFETDKATQIAKAGPFRIFPAMHSQKANSKGWAVGHAEHFGYKGTSYNDPQKLRAKVFECIEKQDFRTKMILVSCPECRLIEVKEKQLQDRIATITAALRARGVTNEGVQAQEINNDEEVVNLRGWLGLNEYGNFNPAGGGHNRSFKYYLNVMDTSGKFGVLRIANKHKTALETALKSLREQNKVEPISDFDQGVWFTFIRSGTGGNMNFSVIFEQESVPGFPGALRPKLAPVTDAQLEQAYKVLPDLASTVTVLSQDQISLLTQNDGCPEADAVDIIFKSVERERSPAPAAATVTAPVSKPAPSPVVAPSPAPVTPAPAPAAGAVQTPVPDTNKEDEIAKLRAQLAALQAQPSKPTSASAPIVEQQQQQPAPPSVTTSAPSAPVTAQQGLDPNMPPDAFASMFNLPKR